MLQARMIWVAVMLAAAVAAAASNQAGAGSMGAPADKAAAPKEPAAGSGMAGAKTAHAALESADDPKLSGTVTFTQLADAVRMEANVSGVDKAGLHGFHLHENGHCEHATPGKHYMSAGGHFNPTGAPHACIDSTTHHAGDFGNIDIKADGTGHLVVITAMLSLTGANTPVGKALVLHTGADDCKTQPTGNSGARLACGVVVADSH